MEVNKCSHCLLVLTVLVIMGLAACERAHVFVKKLKHCNTSADYDHLYNLTFTTIGDKQYADGVVIYKIPLENNIHSHISLDILIGKNFTHILDINERKSCDALHKYFGEFIYDWERNLGIIPGICPIPKGKRYLHNFYMDFKKITTLANFPFGYLRFTIRGYDNKNNLLTCVEVEAQNQL